MKWFTPAKIMWFGGVLALALWLWWFSFPLGTTDEMSGQIGDKFGALNTLFTCLAFIGIVAGLVHQHRAYEMEEAAIIRGIADEMEMTWNSYRLMRPIIEAVGEDEIFPMRQPELISVFPIFTANAAHIGKIKNHGLRRRFLSAYFANITQLTLFKNNACAINDLEDAERKIDGLRSSSAQSRLDRNREIAVSIARAIRNQNKVIVAEMESLLSELRLLGFIQPTESASDLP
jgi:hypothetical protein